MKAIENKWMRAAVPALLIHCSIGTVYCWSSFSTTLADTIGTSPALMGVAFSLAIFFLGMSAAFGGPFIERNIHKASLIAYMCFTAGMVGTGLAGLSGNQLTALIMRLSGSYEVLFAVLGGLYLVAFLIGQFVVGKEAVTDLTGKAVVSSRAA